MIAEATGASFREIRTWTPFQARARMMTWQDMEQLEGFERMSPENKAAFAQREKESRINRLATMLSRKFRKPDGHKDR